MRPAQICFHFDSQEEVYGQALELGDLINDGDVYDSPIHGTWKKVPTGLCGKTVERSAGAGAYIVRPLPVLEFW